MTHGVIRERLGFTRAEWAALPWHEARGYIEYLRETADRAAGIEPAEPAEPVPAERALAAVHDLPTPPPAPPEDYDPADDPTPPAPIQPLRWDDPPAPAPAARRDRPGWLPRLPITRVPGFGDESAS